MTRQLIFWLLAALLAIPFAAATRAEEWSIEIEGGVTSFEAEFVRMDGDEAILKRPDGRAYRVPLDRLSAKDRGRIAARLHPDEAPAKATKAGPAPFRRWTGAELEGAFVEQTKSGDVVLRSVEGWCYTLPSVALSIGDKEHIQEQLAQKAADDSASLSDDDAKPALLPARLIKSQLPMLIHVRLPGKSKFETYSTPGIADLPECEERWFELSGINKDMRGLDDAASDAKFIENIREYRAELKRLDIKRVRLSYCNCRILKAVDMPGLQQYLDEGLLENVTHLNISDYRFSHNGLKQLPSLRGLALLRGLGSLQEIRLNAFDALESITPLTALTNLEVVSLAGCDALTDLSPLEELPNLRELNLRGCDGIVDLSPLSRLPNLESLYLDRCYKADWSTLSVSNSLEDFTGRDNRMTDLAFLEGASRLKTLDLEECERLSDITALGKLTALEEVSLEQCKSLSYIKPLAGLANLKRLDISSSGVRDITPLLKLRSLEWADVCNCFPNEEDERLEQALPNCDFIR